MNEPFHGLPTRSLANRHLRIDVLAESGPRIVRLMLAGSDTNLLAETPDKSWDTPYGRFDMIGGHRLWSSPEAMPRTYMPDTGDLRIEERPDGLHLSRPADPSGIAKAIEITLDPDRPALTLRHTLRNDGMWPIELAAWALTQMALGGVAILPQGTAQPDRAGLLPDRHLILWPYASWNDPRLSIFDDLILLRADAAMPPCKIGHLNHLGWMGYLLDDVLFCKRFTPQPERRHPDVSANAETYCDNRCIEIETIGPLEQLEPGQELTHDEIWELHPGQRADGSADSIRSLIEQYGLPIRR